MLNKLQKEILLEIIRFLSFNDSLNLFRVNLIKTKISSKTCNEILYRKMLLESLRRLLPYDRIIYIDMYHKEYACKHREELLKLARVNFGHIFLSQFDNDDSICYFIANIDNKYHRQYHSKFKIDKSVILEIGRKSNRLIENCLREITQDMNPREIMYDIGCIRADNPDHWGFTESYTDKIESILSLEYPC